MMNKRIAAAGIGLAAALAVGGGVAAVAAGDDEGAPAALDIPVTLSIGILASMFTAVIVSRAVVNQIYGRRARLKSIAIGGY